MAKTLHKPVIAHGHEIVQVDGIVDQIASGIGRIPTCAQKLGIIFYFAAETIASHQASVDFVILSAAIQVFAEGQKKKRKKKHLPVVGNHFSVIVAPTYAEVQVLL